MKQTMMLTRRGRAFLAVLTEDAMKIETDGTDSSTKAESKKLLRSWGLDDYSITTLERLYRAEDAQALLRSMKNKSLQAEQAKELFLLVQNTRRASDKPLTGVIAEILKETIVKVPETEGRFVAYVHVPSKMDPNDSYFLNSSEGGATDYIQKRLIHRLETLLKTMIKDVKAGKPYVKILGDQLGIDGEGLDAHNQILNVLQQCISKTKKVSSIVLQLGARLVEFKKNQDWRIVDEGQEEFLTQYRNKNCVTVMLNDTLIHPDKEKRFSSETGRKDVDLPDGALRLPSQQDINKARAYLAKLQEVKEEKQHQEKRVLESSSVKISLPEEEAQESVNLFLQGEKAERVRALTPTVVVPVVLGLVLGAILGANNIPAASMLPSTLSAMGSIGFSAMVGASVGLALAIVGFCIGWCCIHEKYKHYKLLSASDSLIPQAEQLGEGGHAKTVTIGDLHTAEPGVSTTPSRGKVRPPWRGVEYPGNGSEDRTSEIELI